MGLGAAVAPAREVALGDERPNELLVLPWGPRPHHVVRRGIDVVDLHAVNATRRKGQENAPVQGKVSLARYERPFGNSRKKGNGGVR